MIWERDGLAVRWAGGALVVRYGDDVTVVDAPPGVASVLGDDAARVRAIVLSSGRVRSVGGLLELLCALERERGASAAVSLIVPSGDERAGAIAEAWVRGWPDRYPLRVDVPAPGGTSEVGELRVQAWPVDAGEPVWSTGEIVARPAVALRLEGPATIAYLAGAAACPGAVRACRRADLAVVEVGVTPWPRDAGRSAPWRMTVEVAVRVAANAGTTWLIADDGRPMPSGEA